MSNQIIINIQNSKHWDQQVNYLHQIQINQASARSMNCPKNTTIIRNMLANPRSKVVTSTLQFLIQLFQKQGPFLHNFAFNLLGTDCIFKLINSTNKVIFTSVHQLIKAIVINCPHSKFYSIFAAQFNTKNTQVRECISSYLLVLADTVQTPVNFLSIVRNWKNDSSKTVRDNLIQLEQIIKRQKIKRKQKQEQFKAKTSFNNKENILIQKKKKEKVSSIQTSQIIKQSFIKTNDQATIEEVQSNIDFLITKIQSDQTWAMKIFAIQELSHLFDQHMANLQEKTYTKIVTVFLYLLDQKRSRVNFHMGEMIMKSIQCNRQVFNKIIVHQFTIFVQKSVKIEQFGIELISIVMDLDPSKYIVHLAQITVDIKSLKQKIILLDLLVTKVCQNCLSVPKASILIKLMCRNIQKFFNNKEVYLPCLAILSHFKVSYPNQFFSTLICLQKELLNRIILIAETIDPQLRQSIINYIHSLKNPQKSHKNQQIVINQRSQIELTQLLQQVTKNQEDSVTKLVQFVFQNKQKVSIKQFYDIIKLTEKVTQQNSLLQLQLLLEEICKSRNQKFLQALFLVVGSCNQNTIQAEYMIAYLRKIITLFTNCRWFASPKYVIKLISIYRVSKCPKVRLLCIKSLTLFPSEYLNDNLIQAQSRLQSHPETNR